MPSPHANRIRCRKFPSLVDCCTLDWFDQWPEEALRSVSLKFISGLEEVDENMNSKPTRDPIKNEADNGEKNLRGTLAMARTGVVDSATSQFFINLVDNDFLNHGGRDFGYAVFGKVVDGMDVVDKIAGVVTGNKAGHQDVPLDTISILEASASD